MKQEAILIPLYAMVTLTFLVWLWMYWLRIGFLVRGKINVDRFRLKRGYDDVPEHVMSASENLVNLFELPVLFYTAVLVIFATGKTDLHFLVCAWSYVALRCVHSIIHITCNRVVHRFSAYFISALILWWMWARLVYFVLGEK